VSTPLRGDEILSCRHRVALARGAPGELVRLVASDEMEYRRRLAEDHRRDVLHFLVDAAQGLVASTLDDTAAAMATGVEIILAPRLADDVEGHRRASVHALVRLGRHDERFVYAPLLIKNSELVEASSTRSVLTSPLEAPHFARAHRLEGVAVRSSLSVTRSGIALAHATRVLQSLGHGDEDGRVAVVDRQRRVWWLSLGDGEHPRFNLDTYDALYRERRELLDAHDAWRAGGPYPTTPYWHRECEDCVFRDNCHAQLAARDDVSLVRYTNFEQQRLLHEFGVTTRQDLARLDPQLARLARRNPHDSTAREAVLGVAIERLDDLIYRARVDVKGSVLRRCEVSDMGCPVADVEVDVDMESYADLTYLWGATVRVAPGVTGIAEGYVSFVEWETLDHASEARIFAEFWNWFHALRSDCAARGLSFASYCFWAQAEDGAMNRAVEPPREDGPTRADLDDFRGASPRAWFDLHEVVKSQIQTNGPLGLKVLARAAGFEWRDDNPSGEASMRWFEAARTEGGSDDVEAWRRRILEYNEDDCRATQVLRDWLNGAAQLLAHRDDVDLP